MRPHMFMFAASYLPARSTRIGTISHLFAASKSDKTNTKTDEAGAYKRSQSAHRHIIGADSQFLPEADRYHLHIALACPWACGILAALRLKGLDGVISHSIVHPTWGKTKPDDDSDVHYGWVYRKPGDAPLSNPLGHGSFECDDALVPDKITNADSVRAIYNLCGDSEGPFTTPMLFDKKTNTIVNNESTEIMRMLNSEFNDIAQSPDVDLYPSELQDELQALNDSMVYPNVNNGVYRCGFAKGQKAYDKAVKILFESLDDLEEILSEKRYLGGDKFTWLDLRLFMTLVRFDPVYVTYFKTNKKRLVDYPNLLGYVRDIYSMKDVRSCINFDHIKTHYFTSHPALNTYGIIPVYDGPDLDVEHGRENLMK